MDKLNTNMARERLFQILKHRSYREGDFTLTSGKKSCYYIDCKATTLSAEGAYLTGIVFFEMLSRIKNQPQAVAGMTLGADPLVTAVSVVSFLRNNPLPALIVRKEPKGHGTSAWIEGMVNVEKGANVIMLEDVVTTGGTLIKAGEKLREAGYSVSDALCIVDREEGGKEALEATGIRLYSVFIKTDFNLNSKPCTTKRGQKS